MHAGKITKVLPTAGGYHDEQSYVDRPTTILSPRARKLERERQENSSTWAETLPRNSARFSTSSDESIEAGNEPLVAEHFVLPVASFGRFEGPFQKEFELFCVKQKSAPLITIVVGSITLWLTLETIASLLLNSNNTVSCAIDVACITAIVTSWIICGRLFYFPNSFDNSSPLDHHFRIFSLPILLAVPVLKAIKEISIGTYACTSDTQNLLGLPLCPPSTSFYSLVCYDKILVMSLCTMLVVPVFHESRLLLSLGCQIIVAFFLLLASYSSVSAMIPLIICVIVIFAVTIESHYRLISSFRFYLNVKQLTEQRKAEKLSHLEIRSVIGNVAHDLKTPLASFATGTEIIQSIISATQEKIIHSHHLSPEVLSDGITSMQTCLQNIRNTNAFMLMTINRCIDYTKGSKGLKLVPKYETIELKEVLDFPIACMRNIQEKIGITLQPLPSEVCSHVITDKQWLQENLLCLLSNAVKYSTAGEVTINTLVVEGSHLEEVKTIVGNEAKKERSKDLISQYLLFEVEDTGIGVPEEAMNSLFCPFKQAQRLAGGTGLGLYSLSKRIEALKGHYGVRKRRDGNQGSLFWFAIPYRADRVAANTLRNVEERSEKKESWNLHEKLEILVVDDSPSIVKITTMMLQRYGHRIDSAENGEIGLKKIESKWKETGCGYDLVLMDLEMPIMDGLEATKRLRKIEKEGRDWLKGSTSSVLSTTSLDSQNVVDFHHQVVFGVSANVDEETTQIALSMGMDTLLEKPLSMDALNRSLAEFCDK